MSKFQARVVCTECDWNGNSYGTKSGSGAMFYAYDNVCPNCGLHSSSFDLNFYIAVFKWVVTKPARFLKRERGHWERLAEKEK